MAGVDFHGKCHGAVEAKAWLRHNDKEERLKTKNHSNKHIDKTQTKNNLSYRGISYSEACERYDARVRDLDKGLTKKPRKDRVTMLSLEGKCPKGLPAAQKPRWFRRLTEVVVDWAGGEKNLIESYWHVDEKHDYLDSRTLEWVESRDHAQIDVIPEVNGRLCCKEFSSRARIKDLNNRVEEMSYKEFNVHFMTGEKKKSGDKEKDKDIKKWETVEDLKRLSSGQLNDLLEKMYEKIRSIRETEEKLTRRKKQIRSEQSKVAVVVKTSLQNQGVEVPKKATFEDWIQLYEETVKEREENLQERERVVQERHERQVRDRKVIQEQWQMIDQEREEIDSEVERRVEERWQAKERRERAMRDMDEKHGNGNRGSRTARLFDDIGK